MGLDPDPARMPVQDVFQFNRAIIDATADLVCAYKPNLAFYEALGIDGLVALQRTVGYIREVAEGVLVIGDGKRGDIGHSMAAYYRAMFDLWGFDALTASPYVGKDAVEPLPDYRDRGVFVLCRTSSAGADDLQDMRVPLDGEELPLYQRVALSCSQWNAAGAIGLVVGATYPEELRAVRKLCPDMPFLIPGVGSQGGDLEAAVLHGSDSNGRLAIINSSRQVLYASSGKDFPEAARREAIRLRDRMNGVLEREGKGWA